MKTHVEEIEVRPYFNAGILVTRPETGLFTTFFEAFLEMYQKSSFREFYKKDERYAIFINQAVLSGVILSKLETSDLVELPPLYNYPIHLYIEDTTKSKPASLDQLITFRHEGFYVDSDWENKLPAGSQLKKWLKIRVDSV